MADPYSIDDAKESDDKAQNRGPKMGFQVFLQEQ